MRLIACLLALSLPTSAWPLGASPTLEGLKSLDRDAGEAPRQFDGKTEGSDESQSPPAAPSRPLVIREDLTIGPEGEGRRPAEPPKPEEESAQEKAKREEAESSGALKGMIIGGLVGLATGGVLSWGLWGLLGPIGALLAGAAAVVGAVLIGRDVGKHCGPDPQCQ